MRGSGEMENDKKNLKFTMTNRILITKYVDYRLVSQIVLHNKTISIYKNTIGTTV